MTEDKIVLLSEKVANQIAAGEVVDRPASAIKEMMENAIDAGASEVIVNVRGGGQDLIQIVDNGVGMTPNDARMAFERHATSKIRSAEDIYSLRTFGFRGEALASISAVAQVELRTRHRDAALGTTTIINGGDFVEQRPTMCECGSQFLVRNLYYNTPARRAFMERESKKKNSIKEEFRRVALCNPDVAFELYLDDALTYKVEPSTLAERIVGIVGRNSKNSLLEVGVETLIVKIWGYIGGQKSAKKSNADQYIFVNGRYFRSPYLSKAITNGYEKIIDVGYYPSYFIFMEVDPSRVDVNVHPQKTEVKFADEDDIWKILNAAVRETLARTGVVPMMDFDSDNKIEIPVMRQSEGGLYNEPRVYNNQSYDPFNPDYKAVVPPSNRVEEDPEQGFGYDYEQIDSTHNEFEPSLDIITYDPSLPTRPIEVEEWSDVEVERESVEAEQGDLLGSFSQRAKEVGDILFTSGRYAWCSVDSTMSVVDLWRAKERLLYDYHISTFKSGECVSQRVLFPIELRLSTKEYELMEESAMEFALLGFDIEYAAGELIRINGIPADVSTESVDTLIYDLLQILTTPQKIEEHIHDRLARVMARNTAKNIGRSPSTQVAREIVDQLFRGGNTGVTPSGKAIIWSVTTDIVKQNFD